ncbi:hypothetical protein ACFO26_05095 [Lactococcus nasutitermitis]|uniref:Uncharacterized protein n=1 Tax=Lactococcus nasutitermitis TaxID=1652957 RepID=A0ABV9JG30_9LACT|nr:hypothetical protein [Lactococcus nasutitermitis]
MVIILVALLTFVVGGVGGFFAGQSHEQAQQKTEIAQRMSKRFGNARNSNSYGNYGGTNGYGSSNGGPDANAGASTSDGSSSGDSGSSGNSSANSSDNASNGL